MAKQQSIGLDIGSTAVRAAEIAFSAGGVGGELRAYREVPLPDGAVRDGEVVDATVVSAALKELFSGSKFSSKEVILGVGNQRVAVRALTLPWAPFDQLRASLPYQVQDLLPMPVDEALLDYYPVEESHENDIRSYDGLLVAAARDTVSANVKCAEQAGLLPVGVDLNAFALLRAMTRGRLAQGNVAIVDIGAHITTVVIASDGDPQFVRALPIGGQAMTDSFARASGVGPNEAERIKCELGMNAVKYPELRDGAEAMNEVATKLVEAIRGTFGYFTSASGGEHLDVVALTGGSAHMPGLGQYLASSSRLNAILGDPLETTTFAKSVGDRTQFEANAVTMTTALGLGYGVGALV
ncbi:type IV pilus assembly protein PilM [Micrococcales bacterium KH10]|nr:type IV pilus assembly protein PilM [Micrococcales bacterium KH10]